ncbi:tetratricopeptide repeat protein [bacterium]|nr:tetratricopeptide repeat protein [bacterium]MBU1989660.1 tetratricopeptide repeat protein [bacterium]
MAEPQEDIIIIEESHAAEFDNISTDKDTPSEDGDLKKKKIIIYAGAALAFILIVLIIVLLIMKSSDSNKIESMEFIEEKLEENTSQPIEHSKLENMIAKANYLYSSGSKPEALLLYEKIALYSEAISQYNLGVAQLKNEQYELALKTFQKAIVNDEKRCVSALNAAVCSLHLNDKESFDYYIDLAYAYLPNEINSPLYSYYYALINYYNHNYLEALSALNNPTSNDYPSVQKSLQTKINALFGNNYDAIESMEKEFNEQDSFNIALLYARIGDLTLANKHFENSILKNIEPVKSQLALGLINLKAGRIEYASKNIRDVTDMFPQEVYTYYPISVKLKDSLFDPLKAQERYRNITNKNKTLTYQKIFYFSPYKVFNADQTISYIRKGTANIFIDNIDSAEEYLKKSASSSSVNQGIAKAIKKALSFKIREANKELQELVAIQPKHSILHYNLALTYAQLGDMTNAHEHFLRSYHLDAKNYLSGVFAIMTSQLVNKENAKLKSILKDSLANEQDSEDIYLYNTLLHLSENNIMATSDWLEKDFQQRPLYLAMDIIIALQLNKSDIAAKSAQKLTILLPKDILPHLMYIDATFKDLKPLDYSAEVLQYLKAQDFHFNDLYFGPYITRYLYIQQNLITGTLYFLRQKLKDVLETTKDSIYELTSALALASLYDGAFEESYTLYNQLIDDLKIRDAHTLFLGAVASTAAMHHENAIALLELSKMKDGNFLESRYALGLLYMEVKNNKGAVIQLSKIGDNGFNSEFFNFDIDLDKLLFEKQKKQ